MLKIMQKWIAYDHLSDMSNMKVAFVNSLIYGDMSTYNIDELKSMDKVTSVDELKDLDFTLTIS